MDIIDNRVHISRRELDDPAMAGRIHVAASQALRSANVELIDPRDDRLPIDVARQHRLIEVIEPEIAGGWVVPD